MLQQNLGRTIRVVELDGEWVVAVRLAVWRSLWQWLREKFRGRAFSTGRSLAAHLKTLPPWQGDDQAACLEEVYKSRRAARFDYPCNPFE